MKTVIQISLSVAIIVLAYFCYESIAKPIRFKKEKTKRYDQVEQRLKDIRTAELAYKDINNDFTGNFDTLINFIKNDSFPVILQIGDLEDSVAVAEGKVIRDTIMISVMDSIFKKIKYPIDSLRRVPFTNSDFALGKGIVKTGSGVKVKVFEAYDTDPFDPKHTLKVGSLTEATNHAGNWE